jgi:hypothetical protein
MGSILIPKDHPPTGAWWGVNAWSANDRDRRDCDKHPAGAAGAAGDAHAFAAAAGAVTADHGSRVHHGLGGPFRLDVELLGALALRAGADVVAAVLPIHLVDRQQPHRDAVVHLLIHRGSVLQRMTHRCGRRSVHVMARHDVGTRPSPGLEHRGDHRRGVTDVYDVQLSLRPQRDAAEQDPAKPFILIAAVWVVTTARPRPGVTNATAVSMA